MGNALRQRRVVFAVFGLAADRYGKQRTAVEAVQAGDDFGFVFTKMITPIFSRQFQRGFVGFRAGIAEKHFVGKGMSYQLLRQFLCGFGGVDIGNVPQFLRLLRQCGNQIGMAVSQRVDRNAARQVDVFTAFGIPDAATKGAFGNHGGE